MSIQDGKKPLKSKSTVSSLQEDAGFINTLGLSADLRAELSEQGLVGRFVDYKKLKDNDGLHTKGWRIYKRPKRDTIDSQEFRFGADPNGYVRRGSLVLAVKSETEWKAHRNLLDHKAKTLKSNFAKTQAEELRQMAKEHGVKTKVVEGYDD